MFRIPDDPALRRSLSVLLVTIGAAATVLRMVVAGYWCVYRGFDVADSIGVEITLTLMSDAVILCLLGLAILVLGRERETGAYDSVTGVLTSYSVWALALLVFAAIVPSDIESGRPTSYLGVLTSHVIAVGAFGIGIGLAAFLGRLIFTRRNVHARIYLAVQVVIIMGIWLSSALADLSMIFTVIAVILTVIGGTLMFINTPRLNWLAGVTMEKKVRLLWLTVCAVFAAIVLTVLHAFSDESFVTMSSAAFIRSGSTALGAINFFGLIYFLRVLFAVIGSLPNSSIVDRRSSEVASLAHLTRLMSTAVDVDHLLQSTTDYALRICGAHGAWTELYEGPDPRVVAAQLVHPEYVRSLHANPTIRRLIRGSNGPALIGSLTEVDRHIGPTTMKSLIVVPILNDHRRTGSLVVFSTIDYGFEQEDLLLLRAFGDMVSVAFDQARLMEEVLLRERLQKEAEVARQIQSSLLPRRSPNVGPFDVHALMRPATEVGGDYFDYIRFADGSCGVIIADVSGKGIPAALYMATLKGAVLAGMRVASGPADLLRRINETLMGSMDRQSYISLTCVQFSTATCSLRLARAGHTPAICRVGSEIHILRPHGVAVGIVPPSTFDATIEEIDVKVSRGDICLLTTDGVTERRDPSMEEIGMDAIVDMVRDSSAVTAEALLDETMRTLERHAKGADAHDDITVVGIVVTDTCEPTGTSAS